MIKFQNILLSTSLALMCLLMVTSCGTSHSSRTGKYSAAKKRSSNNKASKEDKTYATNKAYKTETKGKKSNTSDLRANIVSSAHQFEGTQYKSGGKTPETGFDCSGFTGYIFTQNGIPLSGPSQKLAELGKQKSKSDLMPGDLVFFGNEERISHVAIVSENSDNQLRIVHATTSAGVKTDEISQSAYWQSRYLFGIDVISK